MTVHRMQLWRDIEPVLQSGDEIVECQLAQLVPHTTIGAGIANVTVRNSNLENCDLPATWVIDTDNYRIHRSRCSHLSEGLPYVCVAECEHMTEKTEVVTDNQTIVEYRYEDVVVS